MRLSHPLILASALLVAAPAHAQNDAAPANAATNVDTNGAAPANVATAPANEESFAQAASAPMPAQPQSVPVHGPRGFPWGVLGLLGLIGLLGVRKIKA